MILTPPKKSCFFFLISFLFSRFPPYFICGAAGCGVYDWFLKQEAKVKARFAQTFDLLQEKGTSVGMPYVRPIVNTKLYEIRVEQSTNIYRIFYFAYTGRRFILLHGFQKKTQKTPKKEIELAERRRKEFLAQEQQNNPNDNKTKKKRKKR